MSDEQIVNGWNITTFCPTDIPLGFLPTYQQDSIECCKMLESLSNLDPSVEIDVNQSKRKRDIFSGSEYVSTKDDVSTLRLFRWTTKLESASVVFHIFPNQLAICEVRLENVEAKDADELDSKSLSRTESTLALAQARFKEFLKQVKSSVQSDVIYFDESKANDTVYWPSRALLLNNEQLCDTETQALITQWLSDTHRPTDAQRLIDKQIDHSMTWLKYVVVDPAAHNDYRTESMVLAQYCYTAQEKCNRQIKQAITWAFHGANKQSEGELQRAKMTLEESRVQAKLHQVSVNDIMRHLTRRKKRLIEDIFQIWEYQELSENGQIMLELCADKIQEANSRQAKISSSKTEYILIGISLFTVLDFFFFLTQFSREAMANPTLDHRDGGPSSLLTFVADIPADMMFFSGVMIAGLIFLAYKRVKG